MAKHANKSRKGKKTARAIITYSYKVSPEKRTALTGHKDGDVPNLPSVNRVCDVLQTWYWAYIKDRGVKADPPTLAQLWELNKGQRQQLTNVLTLACAALNSSLSQGFPCALPGGDSDDNAELNLVKEAFAEPTKYGARKDDGSEYPGYEVVLDYGDDKADSPSA